MAGVDLEKELTCSVGLRSGRARRRLEILDSRPQHQEPSDMISSWLDKAPWPFYNLAFGWISMFSRL